MSDIFFSGFSNNYKPKIKAKNITPNIKISQNQGKIKKLHKSPINPLNKRLLDINIKKLRNKNPIHLNRKNIFHNIKNINFINKTNLKIYPLIYKNNKNISKTNLFTNYFSKTINKIENNLRRNYSNKNIMNISNSDNDNFNKSIKNNFYYQNKSNLNNLKQHSFIKMKDILNNDNLSIPKKINKNSIVYPLIETEEPKKNVLESIDKLKLKKNENSFNNCFNFSSTKELQQSFSSLIKPNLTLNNNHNKSEKKIIILNQNENILTKEKSNDIFYTEENFEHKLINKLKDLKNYKNNELIDKIKVIIEETIKNLLPKELQKIIKLLFKEVININKHYLDNINHLKELIQKYKIKIIHYEKYFRDLINKLKNKEKELNDLKKEMEELQKEKKKFERYKINKTKKIQKKISLTDNNNSFIAKLNKDNIDDLEALNFLDKINNIKMRQNKIYLK
jgi:hypothetical protein